MKNKKYIIGIVIVLAVIVFGAWASKYVVLPAELSSMLSLNAADQALTPFSSYARGDVVEIASEQTEDLGEGITQRTQELKIKLATGKDAGKEVMVLNQETPSGPEQYKIQKGDGLVLGFLEQGEDSQYIVLDRYRMPGLWVLVVLFFVLVVLFARWRGFSAIVGLAFSVGLIVFFLLPNILRGGNPVTFALISAVVIAVVSILLAHGFKKRTLLASLATLVTLLIAQGLAYLSVKALHLFGTGSSDAQYLQSGLFGATNLRGVLLAGIIIGVLGVLDDVTTTQTATVEQIHKADSSLSVKELYRRGTVVGKEHIAALVNTLVFAYAATALPLLLLVLASSGQPLWILFNSEPIVEEVVRTLTGSIAIVLAVPISTLLAAYVYGRTKNPPSDTIVVQEEVVIIQQNTP